MSRQSERRGDLLNADQGDDLNTVDCDTVLRDRDQAIPQKQQQPEKRLPAATSDLYLLANPELGDKRLVFLRGAPFEIIQ